MRLRSCWRFFEAVAVCAIVVAMNSALAVPCLHRIREPGEAGAGKKVEFFTHNILTTVDMRPRLGGDTTDQRLVKAPPVRLPASPRRLGQCPAGRSQKLVLQTKLETLRGGHTGPACCRNGKSDRRFLPALRNQVGFLCFDFKTVPKNAAVVFADDAAITGFRPIWHTPCNSGDRGGGSRTQLLPGHFRRQHEVPSHRLPGRGHGTGLRLTRRVWIRS